MEPDLLALCPSAWPEYHHEKLFALGKLEREALQLRAIQYRFERARDSVPALRKLIEKQGVDRISAIEDVLPVCFDHRVLKNYPLSILEKRDFARLTSWLDKLTMHDLSRVDLSGLTTIDSWIDRLEEHGLIVFTSSGTTGKLSFNMRGPEDIVAWRLAWMQLNYAASGVDPRTTKLPSFSPGYRSGHTQSLKVSRLFTQEIHGGRHNHHTLYSGHMSADLLALSGRLQAAEDKGEFEGLGLDAALIGERRAMIEQGKRRPQDVEAWFDNLIERFKGQQVRIGGILPELLRLAMAGRERGLKCEFAPGSIVTTGGGMKSLKNPPEDWREIILDFFGVERLCTLYGFSEIMSAAPECTHGYYHFFPYAVVMLMGPEGQALPREGVQTGRLSVFDLLAETYWGAFVSGDEVTVHFDDDCPCGWRGPRLTNQIRRYSEMEGGDDKITCSGSAKAYDEFMEYVMGQG
ncbi:hypothetical protein SAMN05444678_105191 [Sphingomonas sp. YR710]|uniref:hypothetical protein n=1 Tax=Sphingomonas sp. YR710 TaxID=1882773 RepID=UPI00088F48E4|nr:hypothetical protein [Sphingomonas sp. YR710]SDC77171.1 hypothetical protein SAMN05444678_105191 [Sphingomonas sp. YR710]